MNVLSRPAKQSFEEWHSQAGAWEREALVWRSGPQDDERIKSHAGGQTLAQLSGQLISAVDVEAINQQAHEQFNLPEDIEPTEQQLDAVEQARCDAATRPFHNPKLRDVILEIRARQRQYIDEQNIDKLQSAGFNVLAKKASQTLVTSFREFIETHKDQIEALQILYSRPARSGLKFRQVKELAAMLNQPPFFVDPNKPDSLTRLWHAYEVVEPDKVSGQGGKQLVDIIALVRHAIDPQTTLSPVGQTVEERYQLWLAEKRSAGISFTDDQQRWLDAIKDHIASSLAIERDDLEEMPFHTIGGMGRAYELFGDELAKLLDELNQWWAA